MLENDCKVCTVSGGNCINCDFDLSKCSKCEEGYFITTIG